MAGGAIAQPGPEDSDPGVRVDLGVVVAVPCHRDEPGVGATVSSLAADAAGLDQPVRLVVCVNGVDPRSGPAAAALARAAPELAVAMDVVYLDVASKPAAWNRLRAEPAAVHVFADADIAVQPGSLNALIRAVEAEGVKAATGAQSHDGRGVVARVAVVPHRLSWGGLLGTLYAVRTAALPAAMPDDVLLDDAWLFATLGPAEVVAVPAAVARVRLPERWRDLWRQRVRAERGKRQLRSWGLALSSPPAEAAPTRVWRSYPKAEWPYVAALAAIKGAAALRARIGTARWDLAGSTKPVD